MGVRHHARQYPILLSLTIIFKYIKCEKYEGIMFLVSKFNVSIKIEKLKLEKSENVTIKLSLGVTIRVNLQNLFFPQIIHFIDLV